MGSCESADEGYKLTWEVQGKVVLEVMLEPSYGGVGGRQGDQQRHRVLDSKHSMCKGPGAGKSSV